MARGWTLGTAGAFRAASLGMATLGMATLGMTGALSAGAAMAQDASGAHHKIGIIGSGKVGGALGTLWAKAGDDVMFASRHPEELKDLVAKAGPHAKAGTPAEAAAFGDVVVLSVPYTGMPEVAKEDAAAMKGKVVFDTTNAVAPRDGAMVAQVEAKGIGNYSASLFPDTHLLRAFNAINYKAMTSESNRKGAPVGIPLAADDPQAVKVGSELVKQAGFAPVVVPLARAGEFGPQRKLGVGVFTVAEWKEKLGLK